MKTSNKAKPVQPKLNPVQLERLKKSVRLAALTITGHLPMRDDTSKELLQLLQVILYAWEVRKEAKNEHVWGYVPPKWVHDPEAQKIVEHTAKRLADLGIQSHQVEV
jgi:hypothetical protein